MKQKTILIVDDDVEMIKLLNKILAAAGYRVLSAHSPAEARPLLTEVPHLILTDLHMIPEDGFLFIQELRSQKIYAPLPILVLSALNDFESVKKAIALGVSDYVIKPLQPPVLLRKLKKAMKNDFLQWTFEGNKSPIIDMEIGCEITELGESGYVAQGPFKLVSGKDIEISCESWTTLGLSSLPQKASPGMRTFVKGGSFKNDVTFVGINETDGVKIRQFLLKRNAT